MGLVSLEIFFRIYQEASNGGLGTYTNPDTSKPPITNVPVPSKPTCKELMQAQDSPYKAGEFLTRHTLPVFWHPRTDGSRQLEHSMCHLHRYTAQEARQCFKGKHISMIGDSLTRYQFTSLAWFLHKGDWPPHWERANAGTCTHFDHLGQETCSPPDQPNVCSHRDFWYNPPQGRSGPQHYTQSLGDATIFDGHMEANAVRTQNTHIPHWVDNYLYAHHDLTLSHFQEVGYADEPLPLHGFHFSNCAQQGTCQYSDELAAAREKQTLDQNLDWKQDLALAIDEAAGGVLPKIVPPVDIVLYNRGIWGVLNQTRAATLMPLFKKFSQKGQCYFQSTTGDSYNAERFLIFYQQELNIVRPEVTKAGCGWMDWAHLVQDFNQIRTSPHEWGYVSIDNVHFQPWVYKELNNMLLNILCNVQE